ncbi:DUF5702 domain-containing protein [Lachnotalea sp. AF33-28]|uniref:DUF5702 domain-containing protein n=1 Tax=Lachnotalea sp. AF33-28 TaxID=2292046 RepID=UPI000E4F956C|nr:DUF5702 domain-containing protein [Lachnotalea sp. AF33-28]RHP30690.1 hypothetical protein DWZ56_17955 [Lachnotalea sp. AF33-28]
MDTGRKEVPVFQGQITIFLSLILVLLVSVLCGILETARSHVLKLQMEIAMDSAMESVTAEYSTELFRRFGLLYCYDDGNLPGRIQNYLDRYGECGSWTPFTVDSVQVTYRRCAADDGGAVFIQSAADYMRYGIVEELLEETDFYKRIAEQSQWVSQFMNRIGSWSEELFGLETLTAKLSDGLSALKRETEGLHSLVNGWSDGMDAKGIQNQAATILKLLQDGIGRTQQYQSLSESLKRGFSSITDEFAVQREQLEEDFRQMVDQQITSVNSYIEESGERYLQVMQVDSALKEKLDILEQLAGWAPPAQVETSQEQPQEQPQKQSLEQLTGLLGNLDFTQMFPVSENISGESGGARFLRTVKELKTKGILALVLDGDEKLSERNMTDDIPSKRLTAAMGPKSLKQITIRDAALFNEYLAAQFDCFTDEKDDNVYDLEYMIGGSDSDRENLAEAAGQLLLMREGLNLIYLYTDRAKRQQAEALAVGLVGFTGIGPLIAVVTFLILSAWAFAESVYDVRLLLAGEKVGLIKTAKDWHMTVEQIFRLREMKIEEGTGGLTYKWYLRILLLLKNREQKAFRAMDAVEYHMRKSIPGFCIEQCCAGFTAQIALSGRRIFKSPFLETDRFCITNDLTAAY